MKKSRLRLDIRKSAPAPRRTLLLLHRGDHVRLYAGQGDGLVPLPEGMPEVLPLPGKNDAPSQSALPEMNALPEMKTLPGGWDEIRLCLCAEHVLYRVWHFPFTGTSKVRQALRLALATELPFPDDTLEHALLIRKDPRHKGHSLAVSASVKKSLLTDISRTLHEAGLVPDSITVDPFPALHPGTIPGPSPCVHVFLRTDHAVLVGVRQGEVDAVLVTGTEGNDSASMEALREEARAMYSAAASQNAGQNVGQGTGQNSAQNTGQDTQKKPDSSPEELTVYFHTDKLSSSPQQEKNRLGTDLHGEPALALLHMRRPALALPVARKTTLAPMRWKMAGVLYILTVLAALFALYAEAGFQERRAARFAIAATALFRQTLPDLGNRTFGATQMESILRQRVSMRNSAETQGKSASMVGLLEALHRAVPASLDVRVNSVRVARGVCSLACLAPDYESVAQFKEILEKMPGTESVQVRNAAQVGAQGAGAAIRRGMIQFDVELRTRQEAP